jgi:hypothetical protein
MLVATFGPSTAWMGTRITWDDGAFVLEGHGPITAGDVMDYDRQGHLLWMNAGARAWVGSKEVGEPRGSRVVAATPARLTASPERSAAPDPDSSRSSRRLTNAKRALVVVIIVLIAMNVVLLLTVAGVIPTP